MARAPRTTHPTEISADRRRRDLLAAAYEVIAEKGLEGLRTRDVAARAGVNISTLHYYFGTKQALVGAVVGFVAEKFAGEGELEPSPDPTLRDHLDRASAVFQRHPELSVVLQELALRAQRDPATRAAFRPMFRMWNAMIEAIARDQLAARSPRSELSAHEIALVVTSFTMGAMTQLGVTPKVLEFRALSRKLERVLLGDAG